MNRKRITMKPKNPNPLFVQWLTEWKDKAKENDSKMQHCFSLALKSLKQYPLPLEKGKDCKMLKGFGDKLCKMLDDKLVQYRANTEVHKTQASNQPKSNIYPKKLTRQSVASNNKEYMPQPKSGGFAILVALYQKSIEPNYPGFLTKNEITSEGQRFCNVSFTKAGPDSWYTGWSSMKTLLDKKLVNKSGNPAQFSLTDEGSVLAEKLYIEQAIGEFNKQADIAENLPVQNTCPTTISRQVSSTSSQSSASVESVIFQPNSFQIILLVDTQEVKGDDDDPILCDLRQQNICHEVRNLKVGDYVWICRDISDNELILPYIIERKRMDDFGSSIKDDRFHEQKFRLKQCGLSNLIYLIESYGRNEHVGLPLTTLYQAATNTLVQDGFSVKFTENGRATCEYLACLTNFLTSLFKSKTLVSCARDDLKQFTLDDDLIQLMHFKEFNKSSAKSRNFRVSEMFIKQLLQIKGVSVDKALAIVEKYQTPKLLKLSYSEMPEDQGEKLLSNVRYGNLKKNLGPVLSKTIYQFFCKDRY